VFGCLPYDWSTGAAELEVFRSLEFTDICQSEVRRFVEASHMAELRCYQVRAMWFPEHWADHNDPARGIYRLGSDPTTGASWPRSSLTGGMVQGMWQYWSSQLAALSCGGSSSDSYLCPFKDVKVFIGLVNYRWITGDTAGTGYVDEFTVYPALIANIEPSHEGVVQHELGHVFATYDVGIGQTRMLCEEYNECSWFDQDSKSSVSCSNGRPPSLGGGPLSGWSEHDSSCWGTCGDLPDGTHGADNCLGAPLSAGSGGSLNKANHCFMGHGTGGFCETCQTHFREVLPHWSPMMF
jgi:hypothetical protein